MTRKERVLTALRHRQPDRCPHHISLTQPAREALAAHIGEENLERELDNHLAMVGVDPPNAWREVAPDMWEDEFGVRWDRTVDKDIGALCNCLVTAANVDTFSFPDPDDPSRYDRHEVLEGSRGTFITANLGFSLFERAWTLAGMENLLIAMLLDKNFAHRLLDRILEFNLRKCLCT